MRRANSSASSDQVEPSDLYRKVWYNYSQEFVKLIEQLGASLLVSTYQASKMVTIGANAAGLNVGFHYFEQAMGVALHPRWLAVGSRGIIWYLQNAAALAPRVDPAGHYDACFLARQSFVTGNFHGHEMVWIGDELWIVNSSFNCLCTLHEHSSFVPRWKPPFITELPGDRCHINGLAVQAGRPAYVTVMAQSNEPDGWRPVKAHAGCILDVVSGQPVTQGLAMPHSPRIHDGKLWVLNSGLGCLEVVDPRTGKRDVVAKMPGYTRGLAFYRDFAFVGLSRIRETSQFGGLPIAENRDTLKCRVVAIDLRSGQSVGYLEFETGVDEIFDVQIVPGARAVSITGPYPEEDGAKDVWLVP